MRVSFQTKGDFSNVLKWLDNTTKREPKSMESIADKGVKALSSNTPKDTGETASGWFADVVKTRNGFEIIWKNRAHPESGVNVAKLIELGHGTRTGGYVPPNPYIKQAIKPILDSAGDRIAEELIK